MAATRLVGMLQCYHDVVSEGEWSGNLKFFPERLSQPLSMRSPKRIFVCSMGDLFHEGVPFECVAAVFGVMAQCRHHTFQVLTKRPQRMLEWFAWLETQRKTERGYFDNVADLCISLLKRKYVSFATPARWPKWGQPWPLPNVWIGVTAEDQKRANERVPLLLRCPAAVRSVSCEPLLENVNIEECGALDLVILGAESGPRARLCNIEWIRATVEQCKDLGVSCFVKQIHQGGKLVKDVNQFPADLQVRQLPMAEFEVK
jgi:protein gp37